MLRPSARSKLAGTSTASGASRQMTGSNSPRRARSARLSSSAAAAAGSWPVRGRTRPRYLITSARVQALLSCWASATAFCAARAISSCVRPGLSGVCVYAAALGHTEGTGELVCPARVQLRDVQRATLGGACLEVGRLRELRELALGRRAAVVLLEPRGAGTQIRGDGFAAGGEHAHHLPGDAHDLEAVAVVAGDPFDAEPAGEGFFQVLGDDRGDGADVLVVAERVRGPPFPVGGCPGDVGDLGVDVQLHVAVAGGVLEPVGHGQVGFVPLAGFAAVDAGVVGSGAGVAGFALEVAEARLDGLVDHVVDFGDQGGPVLVAVFVSGLAGQAGGLAAGGVEDRDGLGQGEGQVEEQGALAGLLDGLGAEFALAFGGGMRLGGQQLGVEVGGFAAAGRGPAELGAVGGLALTEQQVIGFAVNLLAGLQGEGLRAGAPPAAWWFSPAFAGLDVIAGRVLGGTAVSLLPDVLEVIPFAQGCYNCH